MEPMVNYCTYVLALFARVRFLLLMNPHVLNELRSRGQLFITDLIKTMYIYLLLYIYSQNSQSKQNEEKKEIKLNFKNFQHKI